ncbi:hypothetical protein Tco_1211394 [Tanacetum coccineum]
MLDMWQSREVGPAAIAECSEVCGGNWLKDRRVSREFLGVNVADLVGEASDSGNERGSVGVAVWSVAVSSVTKTSSCCFAHIIL